MKINFQGHELLTENKIIVGRDLKLMRVHANVTLVVAAEYMGIRSRKTIENWEADRSQPSIQQLILLCMYYGFRVDRIVAECVERAKCCNAIENYQEINLQACLK